jgi:hypothetical protein
MFTCFGDVVMGRIRATSLRPPLKPNLTRPPQSETCSKCAARFLLANFSSKVCLTLAKYQNPARASILEPLQGFQFSP